jgi:predicted phosphodiesterase
MNHIALRYALSNHKNVNFEVPITPYALTDIMGHKFLILHGDTTLSAGNIGKNISTESIKNKVNDLMSGLGRIDVVVMGHLHVPTYTILNNGAELIVNGSMSGIDEYCQSLGIMKNIPSQQMFEVTENYAVGDMRFVRLLEADKKPELEKIIEPFKGLF